MRQDARAGLPTPLISSSQFPFEGRVDRAAECDVRLFAATHIGRDFTAAVVTGLGRDEDTGIEGAAAQIAARIVETFEVEPTRLIYVEQFPACSDELIQARLIVPSRPARFVRVRFDYARDTGFAVADRERIEVAELAYLTATPVECWHRELEEAAACNRLFAMLGELGPARTFELLERAIQHQRDRASDAIQEGAAPTVSPDAWEALRQAVVHLVLCAETPVLPEGAEAG